MTSKFHVAVLAAMAVSTFRKNVLPPSPTLLTRPIETSVSFCVTAWNFIAELFVPL